MILSLTDVRTKLTDVRYFARYMEVFRRDCRGEYCLRIPHLTSDEAFLLIVHSTAAVRGVFLQSCSLGVALHLTR